MSTEIDPAMILLVHQTLDDCGDVAPRPIATHDEYRMILARLELLEGLADRIANKVCSRSVDFDKFTGDAVIYTYNNACHCHPEECHGEFSPDLLFDPDWEAKLEAQRVAEAEKVRVVEEARRIAAEKKKERDELTALARLKAKYESEDVR